MKLGTVRGSTPPYLPTKADVDFVIKYENTAGMVDFVVGKKDDENLKLEARPISVRVLNSSLLRSTGIRYKGQLITLPYETTFVPNIVEAVMSYIEERQAKGKLKAVPGMMDDLFS